MKGTGLALSFASLHGLWQKTMWIDREGITNGTQVAKESHSLVGKSKSIFTTSHVYNYSLIFARALSVVQRT